MNPDSDQPRAPLRSRLKEATSQEILVAAEAQLAADGYASASMAAIARGAGVSVGTLYNYFTDKEQLLGTLIDLRRQQFYQMIDDIYAAFARAPFEGLLGGLVDAVFGFYDRHRAFLRIVFETDCTAPRAAATGGAAGFGAGTGLGPGSGAGAGAGAGAGIAAAGPRQPLTHFIDKLRPAIARGLAEQRLAPDPEGLAAAALAGMIRGVMTARLESGASFAEAAPYVVRVFLNGAGGPP